MTTKNPEKQKEWARIWRLKNPLVGLEHQRKSRFKKYGISVAEYDTMAASQEGVCMICKRKPRRLYVDHDHNTGVVRGLLCNPCNQAIGMMHDNPNTLIAAAKYVGGQHG